MECIKEKLKPIEQEAIRQTIAGKSDVQAYLITHPKASQRTAEANAYRFFNNARAKLSESELLDLYNLNTTRVFSCLNELLEAEYDITYQGRKTGKAADNPIRIKALEMLIKIHGLYKQKEDIKAEDTEPLHIIFDNFPEEIENSPELEIFNN